MTIHQSFPGDHCELVIHDNNIYEFVVKAFNAAGVDAYLEQVETLYAQRRSTDSIPLVLFNCSGGALPMNYTFNRIKELNARYGAEGSMRQAMLIQDPVSARLIDSFTRLMHLPPGHKMRVFEATQRDAAITWLLEG